VLSTDKSGKPSTTSSSTGFMLFPLEGSTVLMHVQCQYHHTVAAVPRWEPETLAWEPETVNRKGLQVTNSFTTP
jgi:hypothetical protein